MQHAEGGDRVVRRYERFATIPVQLLRSPSVSSHAIRVFLLLDSYANWTTHEAFPAQARLAEDMGVSLATVKRAIAEVAAAGYLEVQPRTDARGMRVGAIYTLFDSPRSPDEEPSGEKPSGESEPETRPQTGCDTDVASGQLTGELSGGDTGVVSGRLTGELSDSSRVSCQNETLKINKTDNDKLRKARAGAREGGTVVSSAAPAEGTADTARAGGVVGGRGVLTADPTLLSDLLGRVPGLDADTAHSWMGTYGPDTVRERLAWLEVEMALRPIASPAGWLSTALERQWARPPRSYAEARQRTERDSRRAQAETAAARERAERDAELAEDEARLRLAATWFAALPAGERDRLDMEIRMDLAETFVTRTQGIPPLPEVLTAGDLAARLWRGRLVSLHLGQAAAQAVTPHTRSASEEVVAT